VRADTLERGAEARAGGPMSTDDTAAKIRGAALPRVDASDAGDRERWTAWRDTAPVVRRYLGAIVAALAGGES
jgi:hypothetical protein